MFFIGCTFYINQTSFASDESIKEHLQGKGIKTDVFVVIKDGKTLFEYYARGYNPNVKHLSWSMAKTIAGILIGQAVEDGYLNYSDKIKTYIPHYQSEATVLDLLQMSSGIKFKEEYFGIPVTSSVTNMLYLKSEEMGVQDYLSTLTQRVDTNPGQHFYYSSGDSNTLMEVLKISISQKSKKLYKNYPWERLFNPLGMPNVTFERDLKGTFIGSSYVYATPSEFIKIGQLLMNKGAWDGKQVIPVDYVKLMNTVAPGVEKVALEGTSQTRSYSVQLTTNLPIKGRNLPSEYADLPEDALLMIGHQGQFIIASPSQKLVILRLSMDKAKYDRKPVLKAVSEFIKSKGLNYVTVRDHMKESEDKITENPVQLNAKKSEKLKISDYAKVPRLMMTLAAKEYCSCRFVVKRSRKWCIDDLKSSLPVVPVLIVSSKAKKVAALLGAGISGRYAIAEFHGEKFGCTVTKTGLELD